MVVAPRAEQGNPKGGGNQPKPKAIPTLQMELATEEDEVQDKENSPIPNQNIHRWLHYSNQKQKENQPTQVEKAEKEDSRMGQKMVQPARMAQQAKQR